MSCRPLLSVNIDASYGGAQVLRGLAIEIAPGELLGVLGGSGAGKSTLVLSLLGLLGWRGGSVQGSILLNGQNLLSMSDRQLREIRGRAIGLVPQSPMTALNSAISLERHFREAWKAHREFDERMFHSKVQDLLREVHLPSDNQFLSRRPGQVSVGQAQRVLIALAILHEPSLIIADEPTSALDPLNQGQILDLLKRLNQTLGTAILYISHDLISVLRLVDRLAVLDQGRIVETLFVDCLCQARQPITRELLRTLPVSPAEILRARDASVVSESGEYRLRSRDKGTGF
jgi:peptide/nickel transport system ATP-binding protein